MRTEVMRGHVWLSPLLLSVMLASAQRSAGAQPTPRAPDPEPLPVPALPALQLTPPSLVNLGSLPNLGSLGAESAQRWWRGYWEDTSVPSEWRTAPDAELRFEIETFRWTLGALSLTGELAIIPERDRLCFPECNGPGSSSVLRLKYDTGDIGPLRETGPELRVGSSAPGDAPGRNPLLLGTGFSGKF
jgi:hypothetical protein